MSSLSLSIGAGWLPLVTVYGKSKPQDLSGIAFTQVSAVYINYIKNVFVIVLLIMVDHLLCPLLGRLFLAESSINTQSSHPLNLSHEKYTKIYGWGLVLTKPLRKYNFINYLSYSFFSLSKLSKMFYVCVAN